MPDRPGKWLLEGYGSFLANTLLQHFSPHCFLCWPPDEASYWNLGFCIKLKLDIQFICRVPIQNSSYLRALTLKAFPPLGPPPLWVATVSKCYTKDLAIIARYMTSLTQPGLEPVASVIRYFGSDHQATAAHKTIHIHYKMSMVRKPADCFSSSFHFTPPPWEAHWQLRKGTILI